MNHRPQGSALQAVWLAALALAWAATTPAFASCSQSTKIKNDSNITLTFVELKSAVSPPTLFKSQWKGSRVIAPGGSATIGWTSDYACVDASTGQPNHWDVKLIRKDKTQHYCGGMAQSQDVSVKRPDLCFPQ